MIVNKNNPKPTGCRQILIIGARALLNSIIMITLKDKTALSFHSIFFGKPIITMFLSVSCIFFLSCSDDDNTVPNTTGEEMEMEMESETSEELESAVFYEYAINTPDGFNKFIGVFEDIPSAIDLTELVELGTGEVSVSVLNGDILVARTTRFTKFEVDRTDLSISIGGTFDISSVGIGAEDELNEAIIFSDTEAYLVAYNIGKIVEFNPEIMEIVEVIDFEPLPVQDWRPFTPDAPQFTNVFDLVKSDNQIIGPILYVDLPSQTFPYQRSFFVFDRTTNQVSYSIEANLGPGNFNIFELEDGTFFNPPQAWSGLADLYANHGNDIPVRTQPVLVRRDGTIDIETLPDFGEILGSSWVFTAQIFVGDEVIVRHGEPIDPLPDNLFDNAREGNNLTNTIVNIVTGETRPFNSLQEYTFFTLAGTYNGQTYLRGINGENGVFVILRQDAIDSYTIVYEDENGGNVFQLGQLF